MIENLTRQDRGNILTKMRMLCKIMIFLEKNMMSSSSCTFICILKSYHRIVRKALLLQEGDSHGA